MAFDHIQAFLIAFLAGMSLLVGGIIPLFWSHKKNQYFPHIMSFAAGIMLYMAFVQFLPNSIFQLTADFGKNRGMQIMTLCFFCGLMATTPIDLILSLYKKKLKKKDPQIYSSQETAIVSESKNHLFLFIFLSITIHNVFEGIAAYLTFVNNKFLAIPILFSIFAHNIPEGGLITMIVYRKNRSRKKALLYCLIPALSEPIGAVITYFILYRYFSPLLIGIVNATLAGLLVNTAIDELIPGAYLAANHRFSMKGIVLGMLFIAILLLFVH